ncbi:MAG: hypothetical protein K9K64_11045 [Desulfohalobiaceae bacterium]|nr:hypothetical protein [Desulfohalobiaceae bacterium]
MSTVNNHLYDVGDEELEQEENITHPLKVEDVAFSKQAQLTLRDAEEKIAEYCQVPPSLLSQKLDQNLFWLEPSGILVINIQVPEAEADMFIEIPPGYWWIDKDSRSH